MSDYEQWKKRRERERDRREQERQPPARGSAGHSTLREPAAPQRSYEGYVPPVPEPLDPPRRSRGRGCVGCVGLALGGMLLLALLLLLAGFLYWQQIEQRGQVNVLLLGIDERPNEGPAFRSDTMILAGFDPRDREVALLSIPRDLWVAIPGIGDNRINTANFFGGPTLARETVRTEFGIPLHYYVKLNFGGFVALIDAMGGISLDVPETLHDEDYPTPDYGVTTIHIEAGEQQMDGATALVYARSRYSTSDFDRSRRQQEVIQAVRARLAEPRSWLRAPEIWQVFGSAVETDIPQGEWPALALILLRSRIERAAIGPEAVEEWITDMGAQVLRPDYNVINPLLDRYFK